MKMTMEHWRKTLTRKTRRIKRKTCPGINFPTTDTICTGLKSNPSLWGQKPATNDVSYGAVRKAHI